MLSILSGHYFRCWAAICPHKDRHYILTSHRRRLTPTGLRPGQ